MTESVSKENILGTERIGRLLIKFGMPGIISLVVNSIYNVVDQIFIGQGVGYLGNAATNITYPFTMFVLACGMLIGDGAATNMSLYLGMGKKNEASRAAAFGSVAALLLGAVLAVVLVALMEPLCWAFGATEANIGYCLDYGTIISAAIIARHGNCVAGLFKGAYEHTLLARSNAAEYCIFFYGFLYEFFCCKS